MHNKTIYKRSSLYMCYLIIYTCIVKFKIMKFQNIKYLTIALTFTVKTSSRSQKKKSLPYTVSFFCRKISTEIMANRYFEKN